MYKSELKGNVAQGCYAKGTPVSESRPPNWEAHELPPWRRVRFLDGTQSASRGRNALRL
jgi:hypothetical protein